ncbi:NAD(P)-binding protein [Sarocladium strictum]
MSTTKEVVFVTGANTGLGYQIVKNLASSARPYEILIGSRTVSKGDEALATLRREVPDTKSSLSVIQADVSSDSSLEAAVESIGSRFGHLDILINNAGHAFDHLHTEGQMTLREAWNTSWDTNVTGAHVLTHLAVPLLLKAANPRVLFIASGTSCLTEAESLHTAESQRVYGSPVKGWPKENYFPVQAYRSSKTGLNMAMREWHRALFNDGVKVWAVSPGFLATNLHDSGAGGLSKLGAQDPSVGANVVRSVVEGHHDQDVGKIVRISSIQPW